MLWHMLLLCPAPNRRGHIAMMLADVCLSRTSGLSREQRSLGRQKLAEVAHVTRELGHPFKVKGQRSRSQGAGHIVAASRTTC